MKDSGMEWIGDIPYNWEVFKLKYISKLTTGNSIADAEKYLYTDPNDSYPYISTKDIGYDGISINYENGLYTKKMDSKFQVAEENTILMCIEGGSAGRKIAKTNQKVSFVNKLCNFKATEVNEQFLLYYLMSNSFKTEFGNNISGLIGGVSIGVLKNFRITLPSLEEQQLIADFLDNKTEIINRSIEQIDRQIDILKRYKTALIAEAVTKGIDRNVELKDSGLTWADKISSNWETRKLKYVFDIRKDIAGQDGLTVLSITQQGIIPKDLESGTGQIAESYENYQIVKKGYFAMNHMDLLTGWVDISKYDGVTSPDYRVFTIKNGFDSKFYLYILQLCYIKKIFYALGQGSSNLGRWRLPADKFKEFKVPVPPLKQQEQIALYLDDKCLKIDYTIQKKMQAKKKLTKFKDSLIYEYVTGKKRVEGV